MLLNFLVSVLLIQLFLDFKTIITGVCNGVSLPFQHYIRCL